MRINILIFLIVLLIASPFALAFGTNNPGVLGHNNIQVNWSKQVPQDLRISGATTGWGGWNYALEFENSAHAMISFPAAKLGFGMHQNGHFYWYKMGNKYLMHLYKGGQLSISRNLIAGKDIFVNGKRVCLQNGRNCPPNCGPYSNGQEWTVSRKCQSHSGKRSKRLTCMQGYVVTVEAFGKC